MQSPRENPTSDMHYVKLPDDTAAPATRTNEPQRSRANSDRGVRATNPLASFRPLVRVATMHEEPRRAMTTDNSAVPFLRTLSMLGFTIASDEPHDNTFRCHVCFDDVVVTEAVALTSCGHKFCAPCLKSYLELNITEGNVYPVCFHPIDNADATCGVAMTADQIKQLVTPMVYTKYETFRFNKKHQHARECPYCKQSQDCPGPKSPVCVCVTCGKAFCFFHGNAHEDGTCADYELKHAHEEALSRAKIAKISKPCPGCHCDVEKNGGCNHIKCIGCKTNFCWLCGEMVEDTSYPSHYAVGSGGSCSGMQFGGRREQRLPNWLWAIVAFICRCTGTEVDTTPGEWTAATLTAIPAFLLILVSSIVVVILAISCSLCVRYDDEFSEAFGTGVEWLFLAFGTLPNLVFTPVGWAVDLAVPIVKITVSVIAETCTRCFSCLCRSSPSAADTPVANDLEAGMVETSVAGG